MIVAYVALLIVATWPRFPRVMVPQFLEGMRNLGRAEAANEAAQVGLEGYLEDGNGNGNGHRWRPS